MTVQMNEPKKLVIFWAILLVILLLFIEALCYVVYVANPLSVFGWQYYKTAFQEVKPARSLAGWNSYGINPRPNPKQTQTRCVAAFGDSFTHGDEVEHAEAWSYLASEQLGCDIANYGVGGYGTDQAYVHYQDVKPVAPVVMLGVYQEMLRRNLAASWVFYGMQRDTTLKPYFTLKPDGSIKEIAAPTNLYTTNTQLHHQFDRYYAPFKMHAPYSIALLRAAYYRISAQAQSKVRIHPPENAFSDIQARQIQQAITTQFRHNAAQNNQRFALIFFPTAEQALAGNYPYQPLLTDHAKQYPEDCLIDTGPALHAESLKAGRALAAPKHHFDALANRVIALVVQERFVACGLVPERSVESDKKKR